MAGSFKPWFQRLRPTVRVVTIAVALPVILIYSLLAVVGKELRALWHDLPTLKGEFRAAWTEPRE